MQKNVRQEIFIEYSLSKVEAERTETNVSVEICQCQAISSISVRLLERLFLLNHYNKNFISKCTT